MKIDLANAYIQIKLALERQKRLTLRACISGYCYRCAYLSVSAQHLATSYFQEIVDQLIIINMELPFTWMTCLSAAPM